MKQSEPNTLQRELARSQRAGPHPDADLLTGFAEGTLLAREREAVMAHLATCANCREVVDVAASAAPDATATGLHLVPGRKRVAARIWAPWLGVAAAIAVASSAVFLHQRTLAPRPANDQLAIAKGAPEPLSGAVPKPQLSLPAEARPERKKVESVPAAKAAVASPQVGSQQFASVSQIERDKVPYPSTAKLQKMGQAPSGASQAANDTVSVSSDAAGLTTENAQVTNYAAQTASNAPMQSAAAAQAAPSFAGAGGGLGGRVMARTQTRPRWRINPQGRAESSVADSEWQPVLPNEGARMRVVSVSGNDVWIGGDGSKLYHSADSGTTWTPVVLPNKDGRTHAIAHILFSGLNGTITAEDGATWMSSDGGANWR